MFNQQVGNERKGVPYLHFIQLEMGAAGFGLAPGVQKSIKSICGGGDGKLEISCKHIMSLLRGVSLLRGSSTNGKFEQKNNNFSHSSHLLHVELKAFKGNS